MRVIARLNIDLHVPAEELKKSPGLHVGRIVTVDHIVPIALKNETDSLVWPWEAHSWWRTILLLNSPHNLICACRSCSS